MLLKTVYDRYQAFTDEQRAFISEKRMDGTRTLDDWIAFFAPLAAYDRALRTLTKQLGRIAMFAVIPLFLLLIFALNTSALLALVLVGAVVISVVLGLRLRAVDVPDQLKVTVLPLLTLLREDVPPDEPLDLDLDLRGMTADKQTSEESLQPSAGRYPKIIETYIDDPWLTGRVRLADGAHLRFSVEARVRKRRITKRSSSGKIKTKHKHKVKHRIGVRLGVPKKHYVVATPEGTSPASEEETDIRIALRDRERRSEIEVRRVVTDKHRGVPTDTTLALAPRAILATIAEAYRQVQPSASP